MKKYPFLLSILISIFCRGQNYNLSFGQEIKVSKGSMYMNIVGSDDNNIYALKSKNVVKGSVIDGGTYYETKYSICKFDKSLNPVYENDITKLAGDQIVHGVLSLQKRLYLFRSGYNKKKWILECVELDKETGKPLGELKEIYSYGKQDKWDDIDYFIKPSADSNYFMIMGENTNDSKLDYTYYVSVVDKNLTNVASLKIDPPLDHTKELFELENIIYEKENSLLAFGKMYGGTEGKKHEITWAFKKYILYRFDSRGNKLSEHSVDLKDKFLTNCKLIQSPGTSDVYLSGLYCNTNTRDVTNGAFSSKLDNANFKFSAFSTKEINTGSNLILHDPVYDTKNKRISLVAETYNQKITPGRVYWGTTMYSGSGISKINQGSRECNVYTYDYGDLLVVNIDLLSGSIKNLTLLNKAQSEKIAENPENSYPTMNDAFPAGKPAAYNYVDGKAPFYSSTCLGLIDDRLMIIYNEQDQNEKKIEEKKETKYLGFDKSTLSCFVIDVNTGTVSKKEIAKSTDQPIFMPRYGFISGNNIFLPALMLTRRLEADFRLAKVSVK